MQFVATSRLQIRVNWLLPNSNTLTFALENVLTIEPLAFRYSLRVQKFSPPYLAPEVEQHKPQILENGANKEMKYDQNFKINIKLDEVVDQTDIKVTMYAPPFTTHGYLLVTILNGGVSQHCWLPVEKEQEKENLLVT